MANNLDGIAAKLKQDAKRRPGTIAKFQFAHGAMAAVLFDGSEFKLRITRKGVYPPHDYSAEGPKRERAWNSECETFRRAFGVPDNSVQREDVQTIFYFRIYAFAGGVESVGGGGNDVETSGAPGGGVDRVLDSRQ